MGLRGRSCSISSSVGGHQGQGTAVTCVRAHSSLGWRSEQCPGLSVPRVRVAAPCPSFPGRGVSPTGAAGVQTSLRPTSCRDGAGAPEGRREGRDRGAICIREAGRGSGDTCSLGPTTAQGPLSGTQCWSFLGRWPPCSASCGPKSGTHVRPHRFRVQPACGPAASVCLL